MASGRGGGRSSNSRSSGGRSSSSRGSRFSYRHGGGHGGGGFAIPINGAGLPGVIMGIIFIIFPLFSGVIMMLSFLFLKDRREDREAQGKTFLYRRCRSAYRARENKQSRKALSQGC